MQLLWLSWVIAVGVACPAFATGIDCTLVHDPVEKTICASPRLLALDSRLSTAYATALARDPAQAGVLKRDELEWLGERNVATWRTAANDRRFPTSRSYQNKWLADFYEQRIGFLRNVNNSNATSDLPIARKLLAAAPTLPAGTTDVLKALQATGLVTLLQPRNIVGQSSLYRAISTLAAPPDPDLRAKLGRFKNHYITLVYLPSVGLGGMFTIVGTADCQYWVTFKRRGNITVPVAGTGEFSGLCTRDGGSTGYLAVIDGYPIVINETNSPISLNTDLQWRRWLGGNKWGPAIRVRLRFSHDLRVDDKIYCPDASSQCAAAPVVALRAARRYARDPWALRDPSWLTTAEQARFHRMQALAPLAGWGDCVAPLWFPARVNGKLVVGGISAAHIGCHPGGGWLQVGFWGTQSHDATWWFANVSILADNGRMLLAARIPPSPDL